MDEYLFYICGLGVFVLIFFILGIVCCVRINHNMLYEEPDETAVLSDGLSELENETLNKLLQAFEEDGVNIANTVSIEQYEEGE